jgi:hypothetical protein
MPTTQRLVSVVLDPEVHARLRAEAAREGKSVSRLVRELVTERVGRPPARRPRHSPLLKLCGLADGELVVSDLDRELYEH